MIKFWKSAAKGKSGCPVRPPEENRSNALEDNFYINCTYNLDDVAELFEKKSKLCLNLNDILKDKKAVKNFLIFMESQGNCLLLKCWLELEKFRLNVLCSNESNERNHSRISHAKSLDIHCTCIKPNYLHDNHTLLNWRASASNLRMLERLHAGSSCSNLNDNLVESCDFCEINQDIDITNEAVKLFKKYVALEAPCQLDVPDKLRKVLISNICEPEGQIKENCFKPIQDYLFQQMETKYFKGFKNHALYTKSQIDILTTGSINLRDIIYNENILFYFTEYLEQESRSMLLEFLMAVTHFRDNLINGNTNPDQAQADAIVLYEKYFSLQATSPIGFSTDIRLKIESNICREEGTIATCFDIAYIVVYNTLNNYVKTFLESELYYTYLSEMVKSVDLLSPTNCKSQSDCSSEFSISTHNTLLAMGDPLYKKKRNLSVPDMTIDSNQLYNADALWQRKTHDGLSLGRINSLGRFESKLEPDPDKKDKSILKKMVNKFVPMSTSRVEEEMAWQIAHMIVKDVTDLTMAPQENDNED
ncbi:A-kinase anchor protein 10, mitochondrial [Pieris rapae]|uniref:A-kinase anchor protein 10, mitochondrial n=1 Tax=Pieris rapae TaxID=64459 RepID=UPI001E27D249|nr:A-kinase anchor protein 10, mitochondrial [Pieris rapae]